VISNAGDISDAAIDGYNSYLINDIRNIQSYVEGIERLLLDEENYIRMSTNASKFVREKYSYSEAKIFWEEILLELNKTNS